MSNARLVASTGHQKPVLSKATLHVKLRGKSHHVEFQIIEHPATPVIGLQTCHELYLVKRVSAVDTQRDGKLSSDTNHDVYEIPKKYKYLFDGIGCLEGTYGIKIDLAISAVAHPPRKIPFTQKEKVKELLGRMGKLELVPLAKLRNQLNGLVLQ